MMPADLVEDDWCSKISLAFVPAVNVGLPPRQNMMLPAVTSMGGRQGIELIDVAVALNLR